MATALRTAPSCARRSHAATSGVRSAHNDARVIVPARRLLLRRRNGGCCRHLPVRFEAPRRTAVDATLPPVSRVGRPARSAQVRCAAGRQPRPRALRHAGPTKIS